ncbi:MAG TPA: T9SS type A sorting domain-containing protein, partial [Bacteroidia bacterium]
MEVSNDFLNSQMYIYNSLGSLIFQNKIAQEHTEINIPSLTQGIYQVKLVKPSGASASRSIVQQ